MKLRVIRDSRGGVIASVSLNPEPGELVPELSPSSSLDAQDQDVPGAEPGRPDELLRLLEATGQK
jgi:hypothetical protein